MLSFAAHSVGLGWCGWPERFRTSGERDLSGEKRPSRGDLAVWKKSAHTLLSAPKAEIFTVIVYLYSGQKLLTGAGQLNQAEGIGMTFSTRCFLLNGKSEKDFKLLNVFIAGSQVFLNTTTFRSPSLDFVHVFCLSVPFYTFLIGDKDHYRKLALLGSN